MLDIAWPELLVIGIVAVVAIGPKDLPKVMHAMGKWAGKARAMANDVQRSLEQLNYEAEISDTLKKQPAHPMKASAQHHSAKPAAETQAKPEEPHDHLGTT